MTKDEVIRAIDNLKAQMYPGNEMSHVLKAQAEMVRAHVEYVEERTGAPER